MANLSLQAYQAAERQVAYEQGRRGFVVHAAITAAVSLLLIVLNITVASEFPWAIFPVCGMACGLFAHWYFGVKRAEELTERHQREIEHRAAA